MNVEYAQKDAEVNNVDENKVDVQRIKSETIEKTTSLSDPEANHGKGYKAGTGIVGTVMNDLLTIPTNLSADTFIEQADALGSDFVSDMKGVGHAVLQPVVKNATTVSRHSDQKLEIDMFAKTASAIFSSVIIYAIADIRTLIRNHRDKIIGDPDMIQQFMDLPITDVNVMCLTLQNLSLLQQMMKKGEIDFYLLAVQRYRKELAGVAEKKLSKQSQIQSLTTTTDTTTTPTISTTIPSQGRRARRRSIYDSVQEQRIPNTLEVFDDENSLKELVYAISVSREKRHVMITFRGSVTQKDWLVDGKFFLTNVPNPLLPSSHETTDGRTKNRDSFSIPQSKYIGIHTGFYEYLFASRSKVNGITKYRQILTRLQTLLQRDDDIRSYSINVTGHSLGGALATLFSFYLSLEKDMIVQPQIPIYCINFASPKAGNIQFARAFQELELQRKIICLRVANYRDLITERPDRLTCWTFCFQDAIFRHVGIELQLYPLSSERPNQKQRRQQHKSNNDNDKRYRIRYPRVRRSRLSQFSDDFVLSLFNTIHCTASVTCGCCINDYMKWHSCDEYLSRIENLEQAFQRLPMQSIHELYHNIVSEDSEEFPLAVLASKVHNDINK